MSGQFNLWRVPGRRRLAGPADLIHRRDRARRRACRRPDGRIVLCADHDGDEFHQLYMLDADRGWPDKLTDEPQVQHYVGGAAWSPDGTKFAYAANARNPSDMEVWVRDVGSGETRAVFGEGMFSFPGQFSPDGSKLLTLDFRNNSDTSIHLVDLETGETRELTPHEDDAIFLSGPWAAGRLRLLHAHGRRERVPRACVLRPRIGPLRMGRGADARRRRRHRVDRRTSAGLARQRQRLRPPASP